MNKPQIVLVPTGRSWARTALLISKSIAALSFALMCLAVGWVAWQSRAIPKKIDAAVTHVDATAQQTQVLVKNAQYLVLQSGLTMNQARLASLKEVQFMDMFNARVQSTLDNVNLFVAQSRQSEVELTATTNKTVAQIQPLLGATQTEVEDLQQVTKGLGALAANPDIPKSLANVQAMTAAAVPIAQDTAATTHDIRDAVHGYLHPTWPGRVASWTLKIFEAVKPW